MILLLPIFRPLIQLTILRSESMYIKDSKPAGTDNIAIDLNWEHSLHSKEELQLTQVLRSQLPPIELPKVLIVGGRTGLITKLLLPFAGRINIVEEGDYVPLLEARFVDGKGVEFFFGQEGQIGQRHTLTPVSGLREGQVRVYTVESYETLEAESHDVVILHHAGSQKMLEKALKALTLPHSVFLNMPFPDKYNQPELYQGYHLMQKYILEPYYHQQSKTRKEVRQLFTGRESYLIFWTISSWTLKKANGYMEISSEFQRIRKALWSNKGQSSRQEDFQYDNSSTVQQYLNFHYGPTFSGEPHFQVQCIQKCIKEAQKRGLKGRALDVGCSVGRCSFQLCEHFNEVVGVDFSSESVKNAMILRDSTYSRFQDKVIFKTGDACNLDPSLEVFDLVHAGLLIDRLHDPALFLSSIGRFIRPGGLFILSSPYEWLDSYTAREKWIGGRIIDGKVTRSFDALKKCLEAKGFKSLGEPQVLKYVCKLAQDLFEEGICDLSLWERVPEQ